MEHQGRLRSSLLFVFLMTLLSCEKQVETKAVFANTDTTKLKRSKGVHYHKGDLFTGTLFALGNNPLDTVLQRTYLEGKKHGIWTTYYSNGILREKRRYHHGSKEGEHLRYWPDGKLRSQYHLKNDVYEGNNKEWNSAGTLISDRNFVNGQESGSQKVWYNNGKIKSNFIIKNNRRYGLLGTKNCINVSDSIF